MGEVCHDEDGSLKLKSIQKKEEAMDRTFEPFQAMACQHEIIPARAGGRFKENIKKNLDHYCDLIDFCHGKFLGVFGPVRLITFGEFSITGVYWPCNRGDKTLNNAEVIKHLAIQIPGEETEVLAAKAKERNCYIAAANLEYDPEWPDFHFNCGFLINPKGKIILKYRKITTSNQPVEFGCSPHDVLEAYRNPITKKFDPFPVVDTSIGRIGMMICGDLRAPEIPRIYSIKGADILVRSTSGYSDSMSGFFPDGIVEETMRVRAYDNAMYFLNGNRGQEVQSMVPRGRCGGGSMVIDYMGNVLGRTRDSTENCVRAMVDIEACRRYRETYFANPVTMIRSELFAPYYAKPIYPSNSFQDGPIEELMNKRHLKIYDQAVENMKKSYDYYGEEEV
jgi:predicted amidohydrolase